MEQVCTQLGVVHPPGRAFEFQQYGGQALADFVVEFLGDPSPLRLLGRQRTGTAGGTFCLQPRHMSLKAPINCETPPVPGDWQALPGLVADGPSPSAG